jgi:hypothetical protein
MAKKTVDNERGVIYQDGDSTLAVWMFQGKPTISVDGNAVTLNFGQARHIGERLIHFKEQD